MQMIFCDSCGCQMYECQGYCYFDSIYCRQCFERELDNDIEICGGC